MIRKNFTNKWSIRALKFGLALAIIAPLASCSSNSEEELVGNWVKLSPMDGAPRNEAVSATIDGAGYIGLGIDNNKDRLNDFWKYDVAGNQWTKIADFAGTARNSAVAFSAGGKLYVGTGYDAENVGVYNNDFWAYDPVGKTWEQVADFPGAGRVGAVAFSIDGIGYVGMGRDGQNKYKDFYAYDPDQDTWTAVASFGGDKASFGVAFVIGNAGYVCTGEGNGFVNDFYKFVPGTTGGTWTRLAKISNATPESFDDDYDVVRSKAVAFTSNGKGYIATGGKSAPGNDVWEYDPATDRWTEKTNFEGSPRQSAVAFTINNKGYVLTGVNSSFNFDDIWRFDADAVYNEYD